LLSIGGIHNKMLQWSGAKCLEWRLLHTFQTLTMWPYLILEMPILWKMEEFVVFNDQAINKRSNHPIFHKCSRALEWVKKYWKKCLKLPTMQRNQLTCHNRFSNFKMQEGNVISLVSWKMLQDLFYLINTLWRFSNTWHPCWTIL